MMMRMRLLMVFILSIECSSESWRLNLMRETHMLDLSRLIIVFCQELVIRCWSRTISQCDIMTWLVPIMRTLTELLMIVVMMLLFGVIRSMVHGWNVIPTWHPFIRPSMVPVPMHASFHRFSVVSWVALIRWQHILSHRLRSALMCKLMLVSDLVIMVLLFMVHRQILSRVVKWRRPVVKFRFFREWMIRLHHVRVVGSHWHGSVRAEVRLWLIVRSSHGIFIRSHLVNVTGLYGIDLDCMLWSAFGISVVLIKMHLHHFILVLVRYLFGLFLH